MRTVAFITLPAHGHIAPMLATAKQMTSQGDRVIFFTSKDFIAQIQTNGFEVIPYADFNFSGLNDRQLPLSAEVIVHATEVITDQLLIDLQELKPDLIIRDVTSLWGKIAETVLSINTVVSVPIVVLSPLAMLWQTPFAFYELFRDGFEHRALMLGLQRRLRALTEKYSIPRVHLWQLSQLLGDTNLVFTYKQLQPLKQLFRSKKFIFIPNLTDHSLAPKDNPVRHIYISLGTFYSDDYQLFHQILTALQHQQYKVTVSTGGQKFTTELATEFPEFNVYNFLNQTELLPEVDLIIFSGGMNTTREAIRHGIPMIIIPLAAEQQIQAAQVSKFKLGIRLSRSQVISSDKSMLASVKHIFQHYPTYTANISSFSSQQNNSSISAVSEFI